MGHAADLMPAPGEGHPMEFDPDFIDRTLWEIAAHGGNATAAWRTMSETGEFERMPTVRTMRNWCTGRFRNRYSEIQTQKARQLDERIASSATELSIQIEEGERRAVTQALAGLGAANGVEASMIGRNLSQMKATQQQIAGSIRGGRHGGQVDARGVLELAAALVRTGAAEFVDSTAEEIPPAELASG